MKSILISNNYIIIYNKKKYLNIKFYKKYLILNKFLIKT